MGAAWVGAGGIGDNGEARWEYFRHVVALPSIKKTGGALSFSNFANGQLWLALITFLYGAPRAGQAAASHLWRLAWLPPSATGVEGVH